MTHITHLTPADYRTMPWKNGLGTTVEIAADPPDGMAVGTRFLWRLSLADVAADGPFSAFPGYDRTILVAKGAGMRLHFAEAADVTVTERYRPVRFSGDWSTYCTLLDGPIRDFNLMVDRERATAEMMILQGAGQYQAPPADLYLVHLFEGEMEVAGRRILAGDTIRLEGRLEVRLESWLEDAGAALPLTGAPGAVAASIAIRRRAGATDT